MAGGNTPIKLAANKGHSKVVEYLRTQGASL